MSLKDRNLKAELKEEGEGVILTLRTIKKQRGLPEEFLKVFASADKVAIELNEGNEFGFDKFNRNKVELEIG